MEHAVLDDHFKIITVPGFLSAAECDAMIAFAEGAGFEAAPITTALGFQMRPDVRNNTRVMVDDPARAGALWERLAPAVPAALGRWRATGLNERLRFYRYDPGQQFRWHHDGAYHRGIAEASRLTFMVYLNDGFEGGATEFDGGLSVTPQRGAALMFLHPIRHQGAPVRSGRKYVLRSDVMYARDD